MNKCLIAGLPNAGKSTYIAALSYILEHPSNEQALRIFIRNEDRTYINKLSGAWLNQETLERTVQGDINKLTFSLSNSNNEKITLSIPDIAGEDFKNLILNRESIVDDWVADCDCLLLFINDLPSIHLLQEQIEENSQSSENKFPDFSIDMISIDIQIILMLKALQEKFTIKKLVVCISAWDELSDEFIKPMECLSHRSPILHNFLMQYFPNSKVFGISAQGAKYSDETADALYENTNSNKRAYVVTPDGVLKYDITLPLELLIQKES